MDDGSVRTLPDASGGVEESVIVLGDSSNDSICVLDRDTAEAAEANSQAVPDVLLYAPGNDGSVMEIEISTEESTVEMEELSPVEIEEILLEEDEEDL